jgi:hypothetical protein
LILFFFFGEIDIDRHSGETGCVVMSMDRHSGESRNPGALILKAILDPGFHRGDEKGQK